VSAEDRLGLVAFGMRLRALRARRGISARFVGREAGLTSGAMAFIEAGRCCPSAANLARLAEVLGVTMQDLWYGIGSCENL
jgi:transcriptional regulator with XRE-family HTH domain